MKPPSYEFLAEAILKLSRYAYARNRAVDREPRTVTLTDDEAVAVLDALGVVLRDVLGNMAVGDQ